MDLGRKERFGRYEVLEELGRGAMGIVYKAHDPKINRVVAIKAVPLLGQTEEQEREYRQRFFRESEAAGRLAHPGLVTIFDVGEQESTRIPYIVMEYVAGESLEKTLESNAGKLPAAIALRLTQELAEALDYAHGQGVVHRDLKPANILVTEDGHAKITDFGVARLDLSSITLPGYMVGTPAFMSPEQLNDEPLDGRSDLFSLGVVLYTMVTGHRPFQGSSAVTVSFKLVNRNPLPATVLVRDLPRELDNIISRAMAKLPEQRYQCGMDMARAIQPVLSDIRAGVVRPIPTKERRNDSVETLLRQHPALLTSGSAVTQLVLVALGFVVIYTIWHSVAIIRDSAAPPAARQSIVPETLSRPNGAAASRAPGGAPSTTQAGSKTVGPGGKGLLPVGTSLPAMLQIEVEHHFSQAIVVLWVDGHLSNQYTVEGSSKKRLILFHDVQGHDTHVIQLRPGRHQIKVRLHAPQSSFDQSNTVAGTFTSGEASLLRITIGKHGELDLSLP